MNRPMQPLNTDRNIKLGEFKHNMKKASASNIVYDVHNFVSHIRVGTSLLPDPHRFL